MAQEIVACDKLIFLIQSLSWWFDRKTLDTARKQFAATRRKLEGEMNQLDGLELRDNELMAMHAAEERHLEEARKEIADLKSQQYKEGQILFNDRHKERELISEIAGSHLQNKNLKCKITHLDAQVTAQGFRHDSEDPGFW